MRAPSLRRILPLLAVLASLGYWQGLPADAAAQSAESEAATVLSAQAQSDAPGEEEQSAAGPIPNLPEPRHAVAMHGEPKYPPDFPHFDYVNPDAPKGGVMRMSANGTFDSFNPYIIRGNPASGLSMVYETLTRNSADEPFTEYGLIAETVTMPEDRSWVEFTLREEARWHDGQPITVEDVIFSLNILREEGHPFYRFYYQNVEDVRAVGDRVVRFEFGEDDNREMPLIVGQMPVLPRHAWEGRDFGASSLEPPLGSGPYRVASFEPGRFVVYERVEDYWGADLPINRGHYNFDAIRYDYYRDLTVMREALKAGAFDFFLEFMAKAWAEDYNIPAVHNGDLKMESLEHDISPGMQGFVMNTRRQPFDDWRVRKALNYAFDFEWSNRTLFFDQYRRTSSFFPNSDLASSGLPEGREREILESLPGELPAQLFEEPFGLPETDASGYPRENLLRALELLEEAGWVVRDMRLVDAETGEPFRFEVLIAQEGLDRVFLPFARNLQKLGIDARMRRVDRSQYQRLVDQFDFDMIVTSWPQSASPGNEQRNFWSSEAAERPGSRNHAGIADPAIDRLVEMVIAAPSREELVTRTRALDRALLWGFYVIPHYHTDSFRAVYWNKFGRPEATPPYNLPVIETWWVEQAQAAEIDEAQEEAEASEEEEGLGIVSVLLLSGGVILALVLLRRFRRARRDNHFDRESGQ